MKITDIKKQFEEKSEELFTKNFALDAVMENLLGRKIENVEDEQEASGLLMLKLVKDTVENALIGQTIYRLEQRVASAPLLEHLSVLQTVDGAQLKKAIDNAPKSIGVIMKGVFTEDGGFVGTFKYEEKFLSSFIEPVIMLFSYEEGEPEKIRFNKMLAQLVKETHVFSSSSEISFYPPSVSAMKLYNDKNELVTESFEGFKSFLATQLPSFSREELFIKIHGAKLNLSIDSDGDSAQLKLPKPKPKP